MRESVKTKRSEQGYTLVELIAAITLVSLIAGVIFTAITFGINSYQKIQIENELRDEADLVMSTVINELYTFAPERIKRIDDGGNQGIELISGIGGTKKIYIQNDGSSSKGKLIIDTVEFEIRSNIIVDVSDIPQASNITLECSSTSMDPNECSTGMINIKLSLSQDQGGHTSQLTLDSKFGF
ncbi:prepilin-type N-terminal cleavage/methylation domain-containing protein [Fontibacillus panacisegetis]|uniref:Prepilin-type N-terminal cleavage/methylation domain-containing protein n=1 Tax=Fontibacillus panacisegetis TaxID=670482 RepID=A0A1G7JA61_9BACL|nr:prepilin-type N-terminal cleavage/methylation domain-containing protein [Fontibacillus panacisegetis]SDF21763.1 prepilin-type N-terminal cleavage/methylation domain-containing protein [Fontibacillus panacisegetis]